MNFFRKVALLLFVATFGSIAAQDTIEINCTFQWTIFNEYVCVLNGIEVTDPEATVVIGGNHVGENDNSNVEVVQVRNSNTPFMIQEIFAAFPNMIELDIEQSGLQSINVPDSVQLVWLILYRNNISRIEDNGLLNQTELYYLELIGNGIEFVGENAFAGLDRLEALVLINNNIAEIAPTTFHSLPAVTYLDMERNALTSISSEIFSRSLNLYSIYQKYNQINEDEPGFLSARFRFLLSNLKFQSKVFFWFTKLNFFCCVWKFWRRIFMKMPHLRPASNKR